MGNKESHKFFSLIKLLTILMLVVSGLFISQDTSAQDLFILRSKARKSEADSLLHLLKEKKEPLEKVLLYKQLAWLYRSDNMDIALDYAVEGLKLAQKNRFQKEEVDLIRLKGLVYFIFQFNNLSIEFNQQSLELAKKIGYKEGEAFGYDRQGTNYFHKKKFDSSINCLLNAKKIFEELNHLDGIGYANTHLLWVYTETGDYEKALEYGQKALEIRLAQKKEREIPNAIFGIAKVYRRMENASEFKHYIHWAIQKAIDAGDNENLCEYYNYLSRFYYSSWQMDSTIFYAKKSNEISARVHFHEVSLKNAHILYNAYKQLGDQKEAYNYFSSYITIKDTIAYLENQRNIEQKEILYELKKGSLAKEKSQRRFWLISGVLILIISIVALFVYLGRRRLNRANKLLIATNKQIENQKIELEKYARDLDEMNTTKNKLFSIVSNDISQPLNLATSFLELLKTEAISEKDYEQFFPTINNHLKNTSSLLNNLLLWAKGQMTGNKLNRVKFDLSELLQANVDYILSFAKNKGIQITCILNPNNFVFADKALLEIVCRNLLANAVKFCREGDAIKISTEELTSSIKVIIEDTGEELSVEKVNDIFKGRFLNEHGTPNEAGWGIGLMLCKEFVEKNGGEIWVENQPGQKTTFYFTVPIYNGSEDLEFTNADDFEISQ